MQCFFFSLLGVFLLLFTLTLPGSLLNARFSTMLSKTGGFVWAFCVLSRPKPNEMSGHHSCSVQREAMHNSYQPECATIKYVPRATKALSKLRFPLHCALQDVTHLFNSSSTVPADNSLRRILGWWSIVTFDGGCVVCCGLTLQQPIYSEPTLQFFWTEHLPGQ